MFPLKPFRSSLGLLPTNKATSDSLLIPIVLEFRPFDPEQKYRLNQLKPDTRLKKCPKCGAFLTNSFLESEKTKERICPFCFSVSHEHQSEQMEYNYYELKNRLGYENKFYTGIILDVSGTQEAFQNIFLTFTKVVSYLPQSRLFFACYISEDNVIFLKKPISSDNTLEKIRFRSNESIFDFSPQKSLEPFLLDSHDSNVISEIAQQLQFNNDSEPKMISLYHLFNNCPDRTFVQCYVFSENYLNPNQDLDKSKFFKKKKSPFKRKVTFDWIRTEELQSDIKNPIDGIEFVHQPSMPIEQFTLQTAGLIQRSNQQNLAFDLRLKVFIPKNFEITPAEIYQPVLKPCTSFQFLLSYPILTSHPKIPLQIHAQYLTIGPKFSVQHNIVIHETFYTSHELLPILQTIDPVIVWKSLKPQNRIPFVSNLYSKYHSICEFLPKGEIMKDNFFSLIPDLRWFLYFLVCLQNPKQMHLVDWNNEESIYTPIYSFWESESSKLIDHLPNGIMSQRVYGNPPIAIIDHFSKIQVFIEGKNYNPDSELGKELEQKIKLRFPFPTSIEVYERAEFASKCDRTQKERIQQVIEKYSSV